MGILSPSLGFLLQQASAAEESTAPLDSLPESPPQPAESDVRMIVHFRDSLAGAEAAGFRPMSAAGGVASGFAAKADLESIAAAADVILVESSRPMVDELDRSLREVGADRLHAATPPCCGAGVIVGIIDSGIDYTHECLHDKSGRTRILALWDQNLCRAPGESHPAGFPYGVEYTGEMINEALSSGEQAFDKVRHRPSKNHGTLVAGIAAGNGNAAGIAKAGDGSTVVGEMPAGTYVGVAPEADIMAVVFNSEGQMGESGYMFDAIKYLLDKAGERPIVINISQGDNLGSHDGKSGLEKYIDSIIGKPGQIIVKSAGNGADNGTHASGTIRAGENIALSLRVPEGDEQQDIIDIWYDGGDRLGLAVKPPNAPPSAGIMPGTSQVMLTLPNKNQVYVESISCYPLNGDSRIYVRLLPGELGVIEAGDWELILTGAEVYGGRFHAWIDEAKTEGTPLSRFYGPFANDECTITIPGTASKIITVGSYVNRLHIANATDDVVTQLESLRGTLAPTSSRGPTRDGRTKPEIAAPGEAIISAGRGTDAKEQYILSGGTSFSAPHVTGAVALLLEKNPKLTHADVKDLLCKHARGDEHTDSPPEAWGAGKLNVLSCHESLSQPE